jgi:hypothetical protein
VGIPSGGLGFLIPPLPRWGLILSRPSPPPRGSSIRRSGLCLGPRTSRSPARPPVLNCEVRPVGSSTRPFISFPLSARSLGPPGFAARRDLFAPPLQFPEWLHLVALALHPPPRFDGGYANTASSETGSLHLGVQVAVTSPLGPNFPACLRTPLPAACFSSPPIFSPPCDRAWPLLTSSAFFPALFFSSHAGVYSALHPPGLSTCLESSPPFRSSPIILIQLSPLVCADIPPITSG